jgi:hypothetical protein
MDQRGKKLRTGKKKEIPGRPMWDLWWTKWHWGTFFSEYFGFPLAISFHRCSIKMEKAQKKPYLHHRVAQ